MAQTSRPEIRTDQEKRILPGNKFCGESTPFFRFIRGNVSPHSSGKILYGMACISCRLSGMQKPVHAENISDQFHSSRYIYTYIFQDCSDEELCEQ